MNSPLETSQRATFERVALFPKRRWRLRSRRLRPTRRLLHHGGISSVLETPHHRHCRSKEREREKGDEGTAISPQSALLSSVANVLRLAKEVMRICFAAVRRLPMAVPDSGLGLRVGSSIEWGGGGRGGGGHVGFTAIRMGGWALTGAPRCLAARRLLDRTGSLTLEHSSAGDLVRSQAAARPLREA